MWVALWVGMCIIGDMDVSLNSCQYVDHANVTHHRYELCPSLHSLGLGVPIGDDDIEYISVSNLIMIGDYGVVVMVGDIDECSVYPLFAGNLFGCRI